ncbi:MAG: phosphoribosylglycinamide formyltransferase, partial [Rhodoferax sp.]|nr:phosphoribosylglycinamide formyltransferase [Rhodoferax sp.]
MKNIVILISGTGSNMAAIVRAARRENWEQRLQARVAAVISNRPQAGGLVHAQEQGIATEVVDHRSFGEREAFDQALAQAIDRHDPGGRPALVVLAGFMRVLTPGFVAHYEGRLV